MANIIDALVVTLGLDSSGMQKGADEAEVTLKKLEEDAEAAAKALKKQQQAAQDAFKARQRAASDAFNKQQRDELAAKKSSREQGTHASTLFQRQQADEATAFRRSQVDQTSAFKKSHADRIKGFKEEELAAKERQEAVSAITGKAMGMLDLVGRLGALKDFGEQLVETNAHVARMADTLGVNSDALKSWQMAAELAGGTAEEVEESFNSINQFQFDLASGKPAAAKRLQDFAGGIKGKASADWVKLTDAKTSPEDFLFEIARILKQLPDLKSAVLAAKRLRIDEHTATLLYSGPEELNKSLQSAKAIDPAAKEAADESLRLKNEWTEINQNITGAANGLLTKFYPPLKAVTDILKTHVEMANDVINGRTDRLTDAADIDYDAMGNATGFTVDRSEEEKNAPLSPRQIDEMKAKNAAIMAGAQVGTFDKSALARPKKITLPWPASTQPDAKTPAGDSKPLEIKSKAGQPIMTAVNTDNNRAADLGGKQKFSKLDATTDTVEVHAKSLAGAPVDAKARGRAADGSTSPDTAAYQHNAGKGKNAAGAQVANAGAKIPAATNAAAAVPPLPGPPIDKGIKMGAAASAAVSSVNNSSSSTSSNATYEETHIGIVNINAPHANTNADVAAEIKSAKNYTFSANASSGLT